MTRRFAVVGHPVSHSLSPAMHTAAFRALGLDAVYEALDVAPEALATWPELATLDGFNVTVPHKETIGARLGRVEDDARAIGAINTVARASDGRLVGSNTDAPGLVAALSHHGVAIEGKTALVVGAGGSARAAIVGLARAGARRIVVAARDASRAAIVLAGLRPVLAGRSLSAVALAGIADAKLAIDLMVHATSATLVPGDDADRFADALPFGLLGRDGFVVDLVYARGGSETAVVRAARARSLRAEDGLEMLVQQGARSLARWLAPADDAREPMLDPRIVDVMRDAATTAAAARPA